MGHSRYGTPDVRPVENITRLGGIGGVGGHSQVMRAWMFLS